VTVEHIGAPAVETSNDAMAHRIDPPLTAAIDGFTVRPSRMGAARPR